ncbi:hypothetical protein AVEN_145392-1 [Araneus ventricosus]|uniref:Tc1-like transposase DDE domain-containing protein n=1 Tax=Araneus ventricosus TaxID=182803 RepID=A0A4Y2MBK7_ARAVE|nr:hypothetical protein AVEN_145392-1 [Araneus ventricosus]
MNNIQEGVFQQDNVRPHTAVVAQHVLQNVNMLPWPARSPDLSTIEYVWDIIERQLQRHPQPALTIPVLTDQVQQAWNSIPQTDTRRLYDTMHAYFGIDLRTRYGRQLNLFGNFLPKSGIHGCCSERAVRRVLGWLARSCGVWRETAPAVVNSNKRIFLETRSLC